MLRCRAARPPTSSPHSPPPDTCTAGGAGGLAERAGAVGMAAALDEELNLKEQARAAAMAERQVQRREAKEWLEDQVPRLSGK